MNKCHKWNTGSMWSKGLPDKMYVGQWPTFHGPVNLSYILKTVWWINVVLEVLIQCDTKLNWNYICRPVTYISWSSDFALYLEDYLMVGIPYIGSILWILVRIWAIDLYFMIKWYRIIYVILPKVACWSLIWKYCDCSKVRNRPVVYSRGNARVA